MGLLDQINLIDHITYLALTDFLRILLLLLCFFLLYPHNILCYPHSRFLYANFIFPNFWNAIKLLLSFKYPISPDTLIFDGILNNKCIWSGHISLSIIFTPFHLHKSLMISRISALNSLYIIFLLFFLAFHHFTAVPGLLSFFHLYIKSRESREQHFWKDFYENRRSAH